MRFVNHVESGTSSIVLTLTARTSRLSPGLKNVCSAKSKALLPSMGLTPLASNARSSSTCSGSSGKKRGDCDKPVTDAAHTAATHSTTSRLEDMAEPENEVFTAAAAEGALDTKEHTVLGAESEADSVV